MIFDGFISYSHAADGRLAPAVQHGLHRLAKPWHRRRALWIFRDQTGLAVTPGLWSSIQTAMDGSQYFVLLASPEAAQSPWVNREIEHWIATKSADRILPVVTDGEWAWDEDRGDFAEDSTAVPSALRGVFTEEPFFLDLRWARGSEHLSLQHSRFRDAIAQLAAPMHGMSKDDLEGEDVRQHRRARRLRSGAAVTLVVLALLASLTGMSAVRNAERAKAAAAEALRQKQVADSQRDNAERSAEEARRQQEEARRQQDLAEQQQTRAAQAKAQAELAERSAQEQQELADAAAVEARRQRRLADQATDRKQEQERLAKAASERAQRLQKEAKRLADIAAEQRRLADEAAAEAARQQAKADQQQRVAISRRLLNQATVSIVDDPHTALMLGAAAQNLNPDKATRSQVTGLVTSTSYAGTLGNVTAATYGPDGVLAALGNDGLVTLWNVTDPRKPVRIAALRDPAMPGRPVVFSRDGRTLAVVDAQGKAALWDVAVRSRPVRLGTLPSGNDVSAMAFSANGAIFVTGDDYGNEYIWDTADRARPVLFSTDVIATRGVQRLGISPNGRLLIVDHLRFIPVYDLTDPALPVNTEAFLGFGGDPFAFSPDGSTLAVGNSDGRVSLWDMTNRTPDFGTSSTMRAKAVAEAPDGPQPPPEMPEMPDLDDDPYNVVTGLTGPVTEVAWSPDGNTLAAGDVNGSVAVWDQSATASPGAVTGMRAAHGPIDTLSFAPDGGTLVSTDGSATATLWHVTPPGAPGPHATITDPAGMPRATYFSRDGRSLITANADGTASTWNTADPNHPVRGADSTLRTEDVGSAAFSPDGRTVATVGAETGTLTVADTARPSRTTTLTTLPESKRGALLFSPDGRTLAVASATSLMLWDVADRARPVLRADRNGISLGGTVAFSPDGRTLAAARGNDSLVTLWNVADRSAPARLATLAGHSANVMSLAFTPDGRTLASGSFDSTTVLWDVADRARPHRLATVPDPSRWVNSVAFSPDGRTLAVAGVDYVVTLWDTTNPALPIRLGTVRTTDGAAPYDVVFRGDGRTLAVIAQTYREGATVALWNYDKLNSLRADPARYACATTGRGLTAAEWTRFVPEIKYRRTCPK